MEQNVIVEQEDFVVQMRGISKVYPNGIAANKNVDFFLRRGEIHAIMGENGAGKSTLMKILFGLEEPTSGEILINGQPVAITSPAKLSHSESAWYTSTLCWSPA